MENVPYVIDDKFSPDYVFDNLIIKESNIPRIVSVKTSVGIFRVKSNSDRYILFKEKGLKCFKCGFTATYAKLTVTSPGRAHFNFYGLDRYGKEVMLTKDHILPKCIAKSNRKLEKTIESQDNFQPLCRHCNNKKKNNPELDLLSDPNGIVPDNFKYKDYEVSMFVVPVKHASSKIPVNKLNVRVIRNGAYDFISYLRVLYDYFSSISEDEFTNIELNLVNNSLSNLSTDQNLFNSLNA